PARMAANWAMTWLVARATTRSGTSSSRSTAAQVDRTVTSGADPPPGSSLTHAPNTEDTASRSADGPATPADRRQHAGHDLQCHGGMLAREQFTIVLEPHGFAADITDADPPAARVDH